MRETDMVKRFYWLVLFLLAKYSLQLWLTSLPSADL
jgi:hypothetical protein